MPLTPTLSPAAAQAIGPDTPPPDAPPTVRQVPFERTQHGDTVIDEFSWLADKDNPETLAYLQAENAWTKKAMLTPAEKRVHVRPHDRACMRDARLHEHSRVRLG